MKQLLTAGVDEAGRGPLAGPVIAAAVILNPNQPIDGLTDSKKLSEKKREALFGQIQAKATGYAIGRADHTEIDDMNILQATLLAMQRAVVELARQHDIQQVLVDGNRCPEIIQPCKAIVGGDLTEPAISAASILAKVTRDREMLALDAQYPEYGFAGHKGYPTKKHLQAIEANGVLPIHRQSFKPVKRYLGKPG